MRLRYQAILAGAAAVTVFAAGLLVGRSQIAAVAAVMPSVAAPAVNAAEFDRLAQDYIRNHGGEIDQAVQQFHTDQARHKQDALRETVHERHHDLADDPDLPSAGNPQGDVTIVEFFDYRCPYCKASASAVEQLLANDKNVRMVWRDLPILGEESVYLSHLALAAAEHGRYQEFYGAVFGKLSGHAPRLEIDAVVREAGFDPVSLDAESHTDKIESIIKRNLDLARTIELRGTPVWVIGDQPIPGAMTPEHLAQLVADQRKGGASEHS
jgi:protein-disulfide isomerase